jgi:hypothetical protein
MSSRHPPKPPKAPPREADPDPSLEVEAPIESSSGKSAKPIESESATRTEPAAAPAASAQGARETRATPPLGTKTHAAPAVKPATRTFQAPPSPVFERDPLCAEQGRHRPNCDCKGDARKPI